MRTYSVFARGEEHWFEYLSRGGRLGDAAAAGEGRLRGEGERDMTREEFIEKLVAEFQRTRHRDPHKAATVTMGFFNDNYGLEFGRSSIVELDHTGISQPYYIKWGDGTVQLFVEVYWSRCGEHNRLPPEPEHEPERTARYAAEDFSAIARGLARIEEERRLKLSGWEPIAGFDKGLVGFYCPYIPEYLQGERERVKLPGIKRIEIK